MHGVSQSDLKINEKKRERESETIHHMEKMEARKREDLIFKKMI